MKEQIREAWRTNNKIDVFFVELIDDHVMKKQVSVHGGRRFYGQRVHLHNVRMHWLEVTAGHIAKQILSLLKLFSCTRANHFGNILLT